MTGLRPRRAFRLVFPLTVFAVTIGSVLPYPDGTAQVLVLITLLERTPASLITRLFAVANVALPAPVVQLVALTLIGLAALIGPLLLSRTAWPRIALPLAARASLLIELILHRCLLRDESLLMESIHPPPPRVLRKPRAAGTGVQIRRQE